MSYNTNTCLLKPISPTRNYTVNSCITSKSPDRYAIMENMRHYLFTQNPLEALFLGRRFQSYLAGGPGDANISKL